MVGNSPPGVSRSTFFSYYVVGLFAVTNALSYADRAMITLLIQPIKRDLLLSDVQIGLLTGVAFGVAYSLVSLPAGWLADRYPRNWIASFGALVWTFATGASGAALSFGPLFFFRVGVGAGEAVVYPTAMTTVPDFVSSRRTPHAIATIITGGFIGSGLALIGGGIILRLHGDHGMFATLFGRVAAWRVALFSAAVPGLIVAALLAFTLRDPRMSARRIAADVPATSPVSVWAYFSAHKGMIGALVVGMAFCNLFGSGLSAWMPTVIIRTYRLSAGVVGTTFGFASIVSGCIGPFLAAAVADWLQRRGHKDALLRTAVGCVLLSLPCAVYAPLAPSAGISIFFQAFASMLLYGPYTMAAAALQQVVPRGLRGQFTAAYLFVINMVGLGAGPLIVAFLTDKVFGDEGKIRYSVALWALMTLPLGALMLWRVMKPLRAFSHDPVTEAGSLRTKDAYGSQG